MHVSHWLRQEGCDVGPERHFVSEEETGRAGKPHPALRRGCGRLHPDVAIAVDVAVLRDVLIVSRVLQPQATGSGRRLEERVTVGPQPAPEPQRLRQPEARHRTQQRVGGRRAVRPVVRDHVHDVGFFSAAGVVERPIVAQQQSFQLATLTQRHAVEGEDGAGQREAARHLGQDQLGLDGATANGEMQFVGTLVGINVIKYEYTLRKTVLLL